MHGHMNIKFIANSLAATNIILCVCDDQEQNLWEQNNL